MDWLSIVLRIVHIGAAVFWVGSAAFMFFFLQPSASALGPQAGPVMAHLNARRRLPQVIGVSAVLTILAGLLLYADASGGFDADWITSPVGIGFTVGGAAAIIAWVLGLVAIRPMVARMGEVRGGGRGRWTAITRAGRRDAGAGTARPLAGVGQHHSAAYRRGGDGCGPVPLGADRSPSSARSSSRRVPFLVDPRCCTETKRSSLLDERW